MATVVHVDHTPSGPQSVPWECRDCCWGLTGRQTAQDDIIWR